MKKVISLIVICCQLSICVNAQKTLAIIQSKLQYDNLSDTQRLVLLKDSIADIKINLVYATTQNFTHTILYKNPKVFAKKAMVKALMKAADTLRKKGIGLLIFDAYRPYSVSQKMWKIIHDPRYVANPINGSDHNRGTAIDLSLYDLQNGTPLIMPTDFDNFTKKAHLSYQPASKEILQNRSLLQNTMKSVGLIPLATEWWHFYLPNSKDYPILNIDFKYL